MFGVRCANVGALYELGPKTVLIAQDQRVGEGVAAQGGLRFEHPLEDGLDASHLEVVLEPAGNALSEQGELVVGQSGGGDEGSEGHRVGRRWLSVYIVSGSVISPCKVGGALGCVYIKANTPGMNGH